MHKLFDIIKINEIAKAILNKTRNLKENSLVNGYVTITKNKGRKDEIILQQDIN